MLVIWAHVTRQGGDPVEPTVKLELAMIQNAMDLYEIDHGVLPAAMAEADSAKWYMTLSNYASGHPSWETSRKFVDYWGSDYRFSLSARGTTNRPGNREIRIWSCGPNKRDEQGKGDDIVLVRVLSR